MENAKRLGFALLVSMLLHAALLPCAVRLWKPVPPKPPDGEPFFVELVPPAPQPLRFVESGAPADAPPDNTDLVAEQDARAQDNFDAQGPENAPAIEELAEFDQLAAARPAAESAPTPPSNPAAERPLSPSPSDESGPAQSETPSETSATVDLDSPATVLEPFDTAKADPQALPASPERVGPPGKSCGRIEGGVKDSAFLSFEAMRHELAPYLKEIQDRVERRWLAALTMRYNGTSPTKAIVDCAIRQDGTLAFAITVDPGSSATFGGLCRESVERAGPFPPFPFKVPDIYRQKNLEIRWTFNFL